MALMKTLDHASGAQATYWRVIEVAVNYFAGVGGVALAGYVSKVARQAGKAPLDSRQLAIPKDVVASAFSPAALDAAGNNHVKAAYLFVKGAVAAEGQPVNPFADAVDDLD